MSAIHGYNIYNHGARVYNDTQTQTQPASTTVTTAQPNTTMATSASTADRVSISSAGRAAVASTVTSASTPAQTVNSTSTANSSSSAQTENKDLNRFISGFTKSGHTKEQAISAYNTYAAIASQQGARA